MSPGASEAQRQRSLLKNQWNEVDAIFMPDIWALASPLQRCKLSPYAAEFLATMVVVVEGLSYGGSVSCAVSNALLKSGAYQEKKKKAQGKTQCYELWLATAKLEKDSSKEKKSELEKLNFKTSAVYPGDRHPDNLLSKRLPTSNYFDSSPSSTEGAG